jgi:hypothetical protein
MSGKTGRRVTARKPEETRRHDSLAAGAFGREGPENVRAGEELNRKLAGRPSKQHSKYRARQEKAKHA